MALTQSLPISGSLADLAVAELAAAADPARDPDRIPAVSIVVGSYNRLTCLCELLQRFLEQDFRDFEVIVIEQTTRATDLERRRLRELVTSDARIRVFQRPPLGGAGARNEGCRLARAAIIVAFDDDDLPGSRGWLSAMVRNFDDPKCLGVSGRHILEGGANPPYANMERARRRVLSYSWLMWQRCYPCVDQRSEKIQNMMGGNSAFRRSVFERAGLWDTFPRCENENSLFFRLRPRMAPGEYLVFDPEVIMIRRLGIEGGMGKRQCGVFEVGWRTFEYFHKVIGYYHPARFVALYPLYFALFFVIMYDDFITYGADREHAAKRIARLFGFYAVMPVMWLFWLGRLTIDRVLTGPEKREREFAPYEISAAPP